MYDLGTINSFPTSASGMIVLFKNVNKKKKKSVSFDKKKKPTNQPKWWYTCEFWFSLYDRCRGGSTNQQSAVNMIIHWLDSF